MTASSTLQTDIAQRADDQRCNLCEARSFELIARSDRHGQPLHTVMCSECGLVFTNPLPDDADLREFYALRYRRVYKRSAEPLRRHAYRESGRALQRFEHIRAYVQPGAKTLDVGCGAGFFPFVMRYAGADAWGLEPNEAYAGWGQRMLDLHIQPGFVQDLEPQGGSFDVITMFHVLEHLSDPGAALSRLHACLANDGVLVVEVPNIESTFHAPEHSFHAAHLYNFNASTLCALARRHGFDVESVRTLRATQHLFAVFRRNRHRATAQESRMPENAFRVASALATHTRARHYTSPFVYARWALKMLGYIEERAAVALTPSSRDIVKRRVVGALSASGQGVVPRFRRSLGLGA